MQKSLPWKGNIVISVGGYIGDSTRSEIDYAIEHGKKVKYLEEESISRTCFFQKICKRLAGFYAMDWIMRYYEKGRNTDFWHQEVQ